MNLRIFCLLLSALISTGCTSKPPSGSPGYAEGDYVYISSPQPGSLLTLAVRAGQAVHANDLLFRLEAQTERDARDEAAAKLAVAQAQVADASKGRRSDEVAVTLAQLAQARAQAGVAATELARQQALVAQGFIAPSRLDDLRATAEQARARVAEVEAAVRVASLPARGDARAAASASAQAAQAALAQTEWRERQKEQRAPAEAVVSDTFFRAGEWVPAGQPVLSLLPQGATKARFFVSEQELARYPVGQRVSIRCEGCNPPIPARVERIASQPEYTPPVIYSREQRARLVFAVEARPDAKDGARLRPGQPIDVLPATGTSTQ